MFSKVMGEGQAWSLENEDTASFSFDNYHSHNSKKVIFILSARVFSDLLDTTIDFLS